MDLLPFRPESARSAGATWPGPSPCDPDHGFRLTVVVRSSWGAGDMRRRIFRLTGLMAVVMGFWLVVLGVVSLTAPAPAKAARTPAPVVLVGGLVHIYAPPLKEWPIPIDRETFDDYQRAVRESDDGRITEVIERPGWVPVADRQQVRVVVVDGNAVQIELVDGESAGARGWLLKRQLVP
jgi:hypothetical protein